MKHTNLNIFDVPEIITHIGNFLDFDDIFTLRAVSKYFCEIISTYPWTHFIIPIKEPAILEKVTYILNPRKLFICTVLPNTSQLSTRQYEFKIDTEICYRFLKDKPIDCIKYNILPPTNIHTTITYNCATNGLMVHMPSDKKQQTFQNLVVFSPKIIILNFMNTHANIEPLTDYMLSKIFYFHEALDILDILQMMEKKLIIQEHFDYRLCKQNIFFSNNLQLIYFFSKYIHNDLFKQDDILFLYNHGHMETIEWVTHNYPSYIHHIDLINFCNKKHWHIIEWLLQKNELESVPTIVIQNTYNRKLNWTIDDTQIFLTMATDTNNIFYQHVISVLFLTFDSDIYALIEDNKYIQVEPTLTDLLHGIDQDAPVYVLKYIYYHLDEISKHEVKKNIIAIIEKIISRRNLGVFKWFLKNNQQYIYRYQKSIIIDLVCRYNFIDALILLQKNNYVISTNLGMSRSIMDGHVELFEYLLNNKVRLPKRADLTLAIRNSPAKIVVLQILIKNGYDLFSIINFSDLQLDLISIGDIDTLQFLENMNVPFYPSEYDVCGIAESITNPSILHFLEKNNIINKHETSGKNIYHFVEQTYHQAFPHRSVMKHLIKNAICLNEPENIQFIIDNQLMVPNLSLNFFQGMPSTIKTSPLVPKLLTTLNINTEVILVVIIICKSISRIRELFRINMFTDDEFVGMLSKIIIMYPNYFSDELFKMKLYYSCRKYIKDNNSLETFGNILSQ